MTMTEPFADNDALAAERDDLRADLEQMMKLLAEARSELAAYVGDEYPKENREKYPDIFRKYHRDMSLCYKIDAALKEKTV